MSPIQRSNIQGHSAFSLSNGMAQVSVIPDLGGRIWELRDLVRGVQWIWHRPAFPLVLVAPHSEYDAVWAGGWEELFPNDAPGEFEGRLLPDHGEWWTRRWIVEEVDDGDSPRILLSARMDVCRAVCTKEISLARGSARVDINYSIVSEEPQPFHFLFKQHLPIAISAGCRILLPGGTVQAVDPLFSGVLAADGQSQWPSIARLASGVPDLSHVPTAGIGLQEFVYVADLPSASCGVVDYSKSARITMSWEHSTMRYLWLFMSYGGWRDTFTLVVEPCTNMPKDLVRARELGQAALLRPGERFTTRASVTLDGVVDE